MARVRILGLLQRLVPRPATVIAFLALSLVASGVAYAANTVGSDDIIDNSIQSIDLKDGAAVKGADVVDNSLGGAAINEATLGGVARRLLLDDSPNANVLRNLVAVGPHTFQARCLTQAPAITTVRFYVSGPASTVDWSYWVVYERNSPAQEVNQEFRSGSLTTSAGVSTPLVELAVQNAGFYSRAWGTFFIRSGNTVTRADVDIKATKLAGTNRCIVVGTATLSV